MVLSLAYVLLPFILISIINSSYLQTELNKNQVQEAVRVGFLDADLVCVTCLDKSSIIVISDTVTVTGGPPTAETGPIMHLLIYGT